MVQQLIPPEGEMARKAGALKIISLGLAAAVVLGELAVIINWLIEPAFPIIPVTVLAAVMALIAITAHWLASNGGGGLGSYVFVIGFILETAVITLLLGGATGPMSIIYIFPILVSSIVIGINYGFLIATVATMTYLAMAALEQAGFVPALITSGMEGGIVPFFSAIEVIFFYLVAFLSWFAASRLHRALDNVNRYAAGLQVANEQLQASEEELRASNEELEAANEELRATEEELRSSNEELEAANEELKQAQEQLIRSEKLAAIGQLAGGVGHELRNPLGAIKNAVYYIRGKAGKSDLAQNEPRVMEFLDIVDDEINASNKIINDLLGFSRVGKPAVSPARIEMVMDDAIAHAAIPENIELDKKVDANLPEVGIDTDQIRQVLVNMITNAVQAMPEGGKLTLEAGEKDSFLEMKIADTGVGMSEETKGKIFDPLYTTRAKGIGLGLAVCKSIIDRHEGQVKVESSVGKGTIFTIRLPLNTG